MPQPIEQKNFIPEILPLSEGNRGLEKLWHTFNQLSEIPRASDNEAKSIEYVADFAQQRNLEFERDLAGNVLVYLPATKGYEQAPGIIFQGHLDMVPQGEPDPAVAGVSPRVYSENGELWVKANNTTLGADNGIGVSMMLALADETIDHGPLALLLTNREEIGLVSAREMSLSAKLDGYKYLINLDSEEEGEATISSAGAADSYIDYPMKQEAIGNRELITINLDGLMGGHSGGVIGENRLNAVKMMADALVLLREYFGKSVISLVEFDGGTARNAIPSATSATIALDGFNQEIVNDKLNDIKTQLLAQSTHEEEQKINFKVSKSDVINKTTFDKESTTNFLELIQKLPNGLIRWSDEVPNLTETSTNIGIVNVDQSNHIAFLQIMSRSSKSSELDLIRKQIFDIAAAYGATTSQPEAYSGWPPVLDSEINRLISTVWKKISGQTMKLSYTHGGLECGVLMGRFPHLQAVSIGPDIKGAHTIEEKVNVGSVKRCYNLVKEIVTKVSSE